MVNGQRDEGQRSTINGQRSTVNDQRSTVNSQRDKETKRRRDEERKRLSSLKVCTVSKSACHNGQSAALLSDSGLVMYFSTLPAPSSSVPCILTILTHLKPRATPPDSMESNQNQPGGLYAREDGDASRMNTKVQTFKEYINERHVMKPFMRIDAEKKRKKKRRKQQRKKRRKQRRKEM